MTELSSSEQRLIEKVRKFAANEIAPLAADIDQTSAIPSGIFKGMKKSGLLGLLIPKQYSGIFSSHLLYYQVIQEIAGACASCALTLLSHCMCSDIISQFGNDYQKQNWLPGLASGRIIGGVCMTEKQAGSDLNAVQTAARPVENGFSITGSKQFITNGRLADIFVVLAATSENKNFFSKTLFVVEKSMKGVIVGRSESKMGFKGADTREMFFQDVVVPEKNLIRKTGQAMIIISKILQTSRVATAAIALGLAQKGFELARRYSKKQTRSGKAIACFGGIQNYLADMATETLCARLLIEHAAALQSQNKDISKQAAMAKCFSSEMGCRVLSKALNIHGAKGYISRYEIERLLRDARLLTIIEGTSEIQRQIIAKSL
jgi:butyryl-CoA dehydrogenase